MRREKGTGCITKLTGNRRKPYNARVSVGYDANGKQKMVSVGCYKTKKEAAAALAEFLSHDINANFNITFADLFESFKKEYYGNINEKTQNGYNLAFRHCVPLHKKKFRELKASHLQKCINGIQLSAASKSLVKTFLGMLYKHAMKYDVVNKNYAQFIVLEKKETKEKEAIPDEEIDRYFSLAENDVAKVMLILIYSGLRIQEFVDLTVDNIDLTQKIIKGGLKTEAGKNRTVPLHDKTFDYWVDFALRSKDGKIFPFTSATGYRAALKRFQKKHNLPYRTPHEARHTCATLLARAGAEPVYIKQILGHAEYSFTVNKYTHLAAEDLTKAINKI